MPRISSASELASSSSLGRSMTMTWAPSRAMALAVAWAMAWVLSAPGQIGPHTGGAVSLLDGSAASSGGAVSAQGEAFYTTDFVAHLAGFFAGMTIFLFVRKDLLYRYLTGAKL